MLDAQNSLAFPESFHETMLDAKGYNDFLAKRQYKIRHREDQSDWSSYEISDQLFA